MNSVEKTASKADEKPVQSTTRVKISQTWLASQTGPIAQSISSRGRLPLSPPRAKRLQSPAPKSAPAKTAYMVTPIQRTTATASASVIRRPPRMSDGGSLGPYGTSTSCSPSRRQRSDIARRVMISAAPSAT